MMIREIDIATEVIVGPVLDATDFKTPVTNLVFNSAGLVVGVLLEKESGSSYTTLTLTSGGANDWTHLGEGYYKVELQDTDINDFGIVTVIGKATGCLPFRSVHPIAVVDGSIHAGLTDAVGGFLPVNVEQWKGTAVPNPHTNGYPIVTVKDGTGTGEIDTSAGKVLVQDNSLTAAALAADAVAEIADAVWDEARAGHTTAGTFGQGVASVQGNVTGSVASIAAGGIAAASFAASAVDAAALAADAVAEIADAVWDEARAGHVGAGTFGQGVASVQGNVTGSVASIAAGGIAASSFAANAVDAAALAADALAEIADVVWDEARAGHTSAGTFGQGVASVQGNVTGSVASIATGGIAAASFAANAVDAAALAADAALEIADAILKRDFSQVTGEASRSLLNAGRKLVNRVGASGGTLTVYKEDDATSALTQSITTTPGAEPITALDTQ